MTTIENTHLYDKIKADRAERARLSVARAKALLYVHKLERLYGVYSEPKARAQMMRIEASYAYALCDMLARQA